MVFLFVESSPGRLVSGLYSVTEDQLFQGGLSMSLALDGESWTTAAMEHILNYSFGSLPQGGWNAYKSCLLPSGAIGFATSVTAISGVNQSAVVLSFPSCPSLYMREAVETVTFSFPSVGVTRSGLPLATADINFTIIRSPGRLVVSGPKTATETGFSQGRATLQLFLFGDFWNASNASCFSELVDAWPTDD